jgi:hypothetical protein
MGASLFSCAYAQQVNASDTLQENASGTQEDGILSQPTQIDTDIQATDPITLEKQKQFLNSAIDIFLKHLSQLQKTIEKRNDIFGLSSRETILNQITQQEVIYSGYRNDITSAKNSSELRALANTIYAYRVGDGELLKRMVLGEYVAYFRRTTQQLITSRYQGIQDKVINAKNQGKDTSALEGVLLQANALIKKINNTATDLQNALRDVNAKISLIDVETTLTRMQKDIGSMYTLFRKAVIHGDEVLEITKEEKGIQNTFPFENW